MAKGQTVMGRWGARLDSLLLGHLLACFLCTAQLQPLDLELLGLGTVRVRNIFELAEGRDEAFVPLSVILNLCGGDCRGHRCWDATALREEAGEGLGGGWAEAWEKRWWVGSVAGSYTV